MQTKYWVLLGSAAGLIIGIFIGFIVIENDTNEKVTKTQEDVSFIRSQIDSVEQTPCIFSPE